MAIAGRLPLHDRPSFTTGATTTSAIAALRARAASDEAPVVPKRTRDVSPRVIAAYAAVAHISGGWKTHRCAVRALGAHIATRRPACRSVSSSAPRRFPTGSGSSPPGSAAAGRPLMPDMKVQLGTECALPTEDEQAVDGERPSGLAAAWAVCTPLERWQLGVLATSGLVVNLGAGMILPALPELSRTLGFGAGGIGLLIAVPSLARVLFNLPAGLAVDRIGRVPAMAGGQAIAAIGCIGTAWGGSLGVILPFRFFMGAGVALASAGSAAYLVDMTERPHLRQFRGAIVGANGGIISAAYVAGPALGGLLTAMSGYCGAWTAVGVLTFACAGMYATLPETRSTVAAMRLTEGAQAWYKLLQDKNQRALLAGMLTLHLNYASLTTLLPLYAAHAFGADAGQIGLLFSVTAGLGMICSPYAGRLGDQHGRVRLVAPSVLACAAGCVGIAFTDNWAPFLAALVVWSVGDAVLSPTLTAYAADIAPKEQTGAALALARQAADFTFLLAPPLLGLLYDGYPGALSMGVTSALTLAGGAYFRAHALDAAKIKR